MRPNTGAGHFGEEVDVIIGLVGHLASDLEQDLKKFGSSVHRSSIVGLRYLLRQP